MLTVSGFARTNDADEADAALIEAARVDAADEALRPAATDEALVALLGFRTPAAEAELCERAPTPADETLAAEATDATIAAF
jgi:hypothetical protein